MTPLHRHQLAWLAPTGWERIRRRPWDPVASECLAHWAAHRLPLVVTRQPDAAASNTIAMGLPAPDRWERRRLALGVLREDVLRFDEFPFAEQVARLMPVASRAQWLKLCARLDALGVVARVHGSYGWEHLSGLDHVRHSSDIDVCIAVSDRAEADAAAATLESFACERPRLDGELVFDDGAAVAWREWLAWRAARTRAMLVKRIDGSSLTHVPCSLGAIAEMAPR